MDVEGVEGGFGGIGDGEAGCVERGGHGGDRLARVRRGFRGEDC